jgi:hypothetical protein
MDAIIGRPTGGVNRKAWRREGLEAWRMRAANNE